MRDLPTYFLLDVENRIVARDLLFPDFLRQVMASELSEEEKEEIKCFYFQVRAKGGVENVDSLLFYSRSLHVNIRGVQVEKLAVGVVSSTLVCRWVRARTWGVHLFL